MVSVMHPYSLKFYIAGGQSSLGSSMSLVHREMEYLGVLNCVFHGQISMSKVQNAPPFSDEDGL